MPDRISEALRGDWRLDIQPAPPGVHGGHLLLWQVLLCHQAWRVLTKPSRNALAALGADPAAVVHPQTRACLIAHGLADDNGLTVPGREVLRYRPDQPKRTTTT